VFSLSRQLSSPDFLYFIAIPRFYLYFSQKKIASRKAPLFSDKLNKEFFNRLGLLAAIREGESGSVQKELTTSFCKNPGVVFGSER
jgi:hypothetical protein